MLGSPEITAWQGIRRLIFAMTILLPWSPAFVHSQESAQAETPKTDQRPFLGAFLRDVDDPASQELGVTAMQGAVVTRTTTRSPAKEFGLLPGDVIVSFDGEAVNNATDFFRQFRKCSVDSVVVFEVDRKGVRKQIEVKLRAVGEAPSTAPPSPEKPEEKPATPTETGELRLDYRNPEGLFQVKLPAGWSVSYGVRGRLKDREFDTLADPEQKHLISCRRKSVFAPDTMKSLEEFGEKNRLAASLLKDVDLTGYSDNGVPWMRVMYVQPESGLLVCHLATVVKSRRIEFMLVSDEVPSPLKFPSVIAQFIQSIEFARSASPVGTSPPPHRSGENPATNQSLVIPQAKHVAHHPMGKRRLIGVSVESAGRPAAWALGIESRTGAVVTRVFPSTPAARAGLLAGDLVVQFGKHSIENLEDMEAATFTSPLGSIQPVTFMRGQQRLKVDVAISPADPSRPPFNLYVHSTDQFRFEFFPDWQKQPNARREVGTERVYDVIESSNGNYLLHVFHDSQAASDQIKALKDFVEQTAPFFLEGRIGRVNFGNVPAVFTSGVVGRERLFTLYRLAFVIRQRRFEVNCFTPPTNDPAHLPHVIEVVLRTLEE